MVKIVVNTLTAEKRLALFHNNEVSQIIVEQPNEKSLVGNIYYGTVTKVVPGMNAIFVNIGCSKNGFLTRNDLPNYDSSTNKNVPINKLVHEGEKLLVQVKKDAANTKGPRLTAIVEVESDLLIYLRHGNYVAISKKISQSRREELRSFGESIREESEGLIFRTSAENATEAELTEQLTQLRNSYETLLQGAKSSNSPSLLYERDTFLTRLISEIEGSNCREVIVDNLQLKQKLDKVFASREVNIYVKSLREQTNYNEKIDKAISKILKRIVWLDNGAYIIFDETEALTVIDVNSGKFVGKSNFRQTVLQVNELAMRKIAEEIKFRNLSGIILIDFINMKEEEDRKAILQLANNLLSDDRKRSVVLNFTKLGILQITRKKTSVSLSESLLTNCPVCNGSGKVLTKETVAFQLERALWEYEYSDFEAILIEATLDVIETFSGLDDIHKNRLEKTLGLSIYFKEIISEKNQFTIRQLASKAEIEERLKSL